MFVWFSMLFEVLQPCSSASYHLPTVPSRTSFSADLKRVGFFFNSAYAALLLPVCFSSYFFPGWIFYEDHPYSFDL